MMDDMVNMMDDAWTETMAMWTEITVLSYMTEIQKTENEKVRGVHPLLPRHGECIVNLHPWYAAHQKQVP